MEIWIEMNMSFDEKFIDLKQALLNYNWKYREKICTKCPPEQQKERECFRVAYSFRMINGKVIQETHCKWLIKARSRKFGNIINKLLNMEMMAKFGRGVYSKQNTKDIEGTPYE